MHKGKVLDNGALCDRAVLFKQLTELFIEAPFNIGYMELHRALVLPSARLHVDGSAIQLMEMELTDGLGGRLAVFHVDKSVVFVLGAFCHLAVLAKQSLHFLLLSVLRQVPNENLHHCRSCTFLKVAETE